MKNYTSTMLLAVILSGCTMYNPKSFVDVERGSEYQVVHIVSTTSISLTLNIQQNLAPAYLASVSPKIIEGNLYLFPLRISSVVRQTIFEISLKSVNLPKNWQNKIYWVTGESIDSPLNPFDKPFHEISRKKLESL